MAKEVKWDGTIEEYQGKKLDTPLKYSGVSNVPSDINEARGSEYWPSDGDILKMIQNKIVSNDKASEYQKQIKPLKEAYENSPEYKRKNLVSAMLEAGFSQAEAEAMAAQKLG